MARRKNDKEVRHPWQSPSRNSGGRKANEEFRIKSGGKLVDQNGIVWFIDELRRLNIPFLIIDKNRIQTTPTLVKIND